MKNEPHNKTERPHHTEPIKIEKPTELPAWHLVFVRKH